MTVLTSSNADALGNDVLPQVRKMNDLERKKMQQRATAKKIKAASALATASEGNLFGGLAAETPKKADAMEVVQPAAAQQSTAVKATPAATTGKANSSSEGVDVTPLYSSAVRRPAAAVVAVHDAPAPAAPDLDLVDMCNDDSDHDDSSSVEEVVVDSAHVSAARVDANDNPVRGNVFDEPPEYNEADFARPTQVP